MAKMIPSVISPEIKSNAEKHVFEWFRDDPSTKDWIILHSLGIANHNKVIHGETDFFVMAPYKGVFALEVKGGRVSRKDGMWYFTDRYGNTSSKTRGPFDQAWEGVHSIIDDLKSKVDYDHRHVKDIFYGIGVMFPDVEYSTIGCDEEQWEVFDVNDENYVGRYLNRLFVGFSKRWKDIKGHEVPFEKLPSEEDIKYLAGILRGDFDKAVSIIAQIRYSEEELIKLTEQQYRCIDQIDDNKRCLITGGAGTGKTLIALEQAKKASAQGQKVALFCFNKNLGEWFEQYFSKVQKNLRPDYYGTFHSYMIQETKNNNLGLSTFFSSKEDEERFYLYDLPDKAREAIQNSQNKYDVVIVDEAQDLINSQYLGVMDTCLFGGLTRGKWIMLGDFSQQAIYNDFLNGNQMIDLLEEKTSFIKFKLTINCRNTRSICDEITMVTGFEPPTEVWSKVEGLPVSYLTYSSKEEEHEQVVSLLSSMFDNHISPEKITILSPVKREQSIIDTVSEYNICNYKANNKDKVSFCTIQGYKGLENTIIILTDIDSISDRRLMYVALSRARSGLYVVESDNARTEYLKLQLERLKNGQ